MNHLVTQLAIDIEGTELELLVQESESVVDALGLSNLWVVAKLAFVVGEVAPSIIDSEEVKLPEVSDHSILLKVCIDLLLILPVLLSR